MPQRSSKATKGSPPVDDPPDAEPDRVDEKGAFAFANCPVCGWRGPGRRSRERARKDLKHHHAAADGHPAAFGDASS